MPELPEVEAVRRSLIDAIGHRRVTGVSVFRRDYIRYEAFRMERLSRRVLRSLERHGKRLFWHFEPTACMVSHLGMSGRITIRPSSMMSLEHTHMVMAMEGGFYLHFSDPRRFGGVWLYENATDALAHHVFGKMGVDALNLRSDDLNAWSRKRTALKAELLSQKTVAGLGNIYVDEALWMARLHPMRKVRRLTMEDRARLVDAIGAVLRASLRCGGTTLRDYRDARSNRGEFAGSLAVYGKAGTPCRRCGTTLRGLVIAQRSTVICPDCQSHRKQANYAS